MNTNIETYTKSQLSSKFAAISSGTFTPYFYSDTGGEWAGKTTNSGKWVKHGNIVNIYGTCTYSSKASGASGTVRLRALPYSPLDTNVGVPNVDYTNVIPQTYRIRQSDTDLIFYDDTGSLQGASLIAAMPASGTFFFNFIISV